MFHHRFLDIDRAGGWTLASPRWRWRLLAATVLLATACEDGPVPTPGAFIDAGFVQGDARPTPDLGFWQGGDVPPGIDSGPTDSGADLDAAASDVDASMVRSDAGPGLDATAGDGAIADRQASDAGAADRGPALVDSGDADGGAGTDGATTDAGGAADAGRIADAAPTDGAFADAAGFADAGFADAGFADATPAPDLGPRLTEAPIAGTTVDIACPDGTLVVTGTTALEARMCLGIDRDLCPAGAFRPGPGSAECADPAYNPFIGAGQCVSDFFSCFNPAGPCFRASSGNAFTWDNGARQVILRTPAGELTEVRLLPAASAVPCVVGRPAASGDALEWFAQ